MADPSASPFPLPDEPTLALNIEPESVDLATYLTVLAVGLRMLAKLTLPALVPSEPVLLGLMLVLLAWGFSQQQPLRS